jgi:hypothetical protein
MFALLSELQYWRDQGHLKRTNNQWQAEISRYNKAAHLFYDELKRNSNNKVEHENSARVKNVLKDLKKSELVVVPTDKTNYFRTMNVEKYKTEVLKHLSKSAGAIERAKLTEIFDNCSDILNDL